MVVHNLKAGSITILHFITYQGHFSTAFDDSSTFIRLGGMDNLQKIILKGLYIILQAGVQLYSKTLASMHNSTMRLLIALKSSVEIWKSCTLSYSEVMLWAHLINKQTFYWLWLMNSPTNRGPERPCLFMFAQPEDKPQTHCISVMLSSKCLFRFRISIDKSYTSLASIFL